MTGFATRVIEDGGSRKGWAALPPPHPQGCASRAVQLGALHAVTRRLSRRATAGNVRITENTLVRVAVDLLLPAQGRPLGARRRRCSTRSAGYCRRRADAARSLIPPCRARTRFTTPSTPWRGGSLRAGSCAPCDRQRARGRQGAFSSCAAIAWGASPRPTDFTDAEVARVVYDDGSSPRRVGQGGPRRLRAMISCSFVARPCARRAPSARTARDVRAVAGGCLHARDDGRVPIRRCADDVVGVGCGRALRRSVLEATRCAWG